MERLTNKREADLQRRNYVKRLRQGYPRNIPEERFLRLAAYEDTGLEPEYIEELLTDANTMYQALRQYEEANRNGRLILTPCAVGDTVYKICPISPFLEIGDRWDGYIVETDCQRCSYKDCDCHDIGYRKDLRNVIVERRMYNLEQIVRCAPHFGTIYFLAREEAERALNQMAKQTTSTEEQE